jgi:raffinose/stachyose/melibiose transport system substrate-binding protein
MKKAIAIILSIMLIMAVTLPAAAISSIAVKSIKLNNSKITLKVGQISNLKVTFTPANTSQKKLTYITANKNVATVNANGQITGVKEGTTTITVYASNKKIYAKCNVTISKSAKSSDKAQKVIKILFPHYQVGNAVGAAWRKSTIDAFNEKFKGVYELVLEQVVPDSGYLEKIKLLNASNDLPVILEIKDTALGDLMVANNVLEDLKPYFDADQAWAKTFIPASVTYNTKNGKIFTLPLFADNYLGVFYNKELFTQAGISEFPKTWNDFLAACDKLKAKNISAIAMMTAENSPTTMYFANAFLASTPEGIAFINKKFPTDFETNKAYIDAITLVQKLFKYSTKDSVGASYAVAANNFCSGKAAMIANGPWMIDTFKDPKSAPAGFIDKVGYALYPGNVGLSNEGKTNFALAIAKNYPQEVKDGAAEYLKLQSTGQGAIDYMTQLGRISPTVAIPVSDMAKLPEISKVALGLGKQLKLAVPRYTSVWDTMVVWDGGQKELPLLAQGIITPQQYAERMSAYAKKYADGISKAAK